jgi:hypothetical protein
VRCLGLHTLVGMYVQPVASCPDGVTAQVGTETVGREDGPEALTQQCHSCPTEASAKRPEAHRLQSEKSGGSPVNGEPPELLPGTGQEISSSTNPT